MARDFFVNGESLIYVKGRSDSAIGSLQELGLASDPVKITPTFNHMDVNVDAWGKAPAEVQWMLATVDITFTMVHFDRSILDTCIGLSMGGRATAGQMGRAGQRMGGNFARFAAGNNFISLNIASPVGSKPWRFFFTYLTNQAFEFPLGTERSLVPMRWRCVPYTTDPAGIAGGVILGAQGYQLYDHTLDT